MGRSLRFPHGYMSPTRKRGVGNDLERLQSAMLDRAERRVPSLARWAGVTGDNCPAAVLGSN